MKGMPLHLLLSLQFYTRIPIGLRVILTEKDLSWSLCYGPLAGGFIGGGVVGLALLLTYMQVPSFPSAMVLFISYFLLTGGIHFDGLADTSDAAGSSAKKSDLLPILKDPRIGVMGATFLFLSITNYLYIFYAMMEQGQYSTNMIWPWIGARALPVFLGSSLPYLKSNNEDTSYRNNFIENLSWKESLVTFLFVAILGGVFLPTWELFLVGMILLLLFYVGGYFFFRLRFGGINGDSLGASIIIGEIVFLYLSAL